MAEPGGGGTPCAGSGNADSAAGAAAVVLLGLFGRIGLFAFGGVIGFSSATTGLGSIFVVADVKGSPGVRMTCTGIVAGWCLAKE